MRACESILKEQNERCEYACRVSAANAERERRQEDEAMKEGQRKDDEKKKWQESRNERADMWQWFKDEKIKKQKIAYFRPVQHQKEQRVTAIHGKAEAKPSGVDDAYKQTWR
eukprot:GHVL01034496.1.p4 GENE.GHVL01034496.1~~GHVL01034496.1.p4  ORF type:complete len:112 (-),score=33.52 GHVL01034496.1:590-925(-)